MNFRLIAVFLPSALTMWIPLPSEATDSDSPGISMAEDTITPEAL